MTHTEMLINGANQLNINLTTSSAEAMLKFMDFMLEWNEKINLTTITQHDEVIIKHFLDSLTVLATGEIRQNAKVIDIGTGAGFPAIPLRLARPDMKLTMLDSLGKRVNFLKDACKLTDIGNAECLHGRAEDYAQNPDYREAFDVATARSVASLNVLCEYCLPYVKVGGVFMAMKGVEIGEELKVAERAIALLGGRVKEVKNCPLPFSDITHSIVMIEKIKKCPTNFPRKAGKPSKEPII